MTTGSKAFVLLSFTLIVGFALGLFADATLVRRRRDRINGMRRPPGLAEHLQQVIQPRDSAQAAAIRPLIQHALDNNEQAIRQANDRIRVNMDSLRLTVSPLLDSAQRGRLATELTRMPQMGRGGPGGRGRGGPRGRHGGMSGASTRPGAGTPPP